MGGGLLFFLSLRCDWGRSLGCSAEMRALCLLKPAEHINRLVDEAARIGQSLLKGDRCILWIINEEEGKLYARFNYKKQLRLELNEESLVGSIALKAMKSSGLSSGASTDLAKAGSDINVLNVSDCYGNEKFSVFADRSTGYKTTSCLIAPICGTDGAPLAVIQIINKRRSQNDQAALLQTSDSPTKKSQLTSHLFEDFDKEDVGNLGTFCLQLGPVLQRLLAVATHEKNVQMEISTLTLRELTREVASLKAQLYDSYDMLFSHGNKTACELLHADRATVWLVDEDQGELCSKVADGAPPIRIPLTKGIVGWVVSNGKLLSVPDAYNDKRFNPAVDKDTGYKTETILCCPVHDSSMSKVIGAVQVINKLVVTDTETGSKRFTEADEVILDSFCQHLRVAIEHCNRTTGLQSPLLRHGEDPSVTDASAKGQDSQYLTSKSVNHMRLSTEALLRFELAHAEYQNTAGHQINEDETESMKSGSSGIDSTVLDGDSFSLNRVDSNHSIGSSNDSVDNEGHVASTMSINLSGNAVEEEWRAPSRRCRCCCCWIPCCRCASRLVDRLHEWSASEILHLTKKPIIYFTKDDSAEELNTAIRYMLSNEQRRWIKFVRVYESVNALPSKIPQVYKFLEYAYPEILIQYTAMVGVRFGPECIHALSYHMHVPTTFMFMGSFSDKFEFSFTELGGLRLITDNFVSAVVADEKNVSEIVTKKVDKRKSRFAAGIPKFVLGPGSSPKRMGRPKERSAGLGNAQNVGPNEGVESEGDDDDIIMVDRKHSWSVGEDTLSRQQAQHLILELAKVNSLEK